MEGNHLQSILPGAIATLGNITAWDDLKIFLLTLEMYTPNPPPVYIFCCSKIEMALKGLAYGGKIHTKVALDVYEQYNRAQMERIPSKKGLSNLFHDLMQEKCDLIDWALMSLGSVGSVGSLDKKRGVLFCDADICWLGPIPSIPAGKTLALSPHMIRKVDETRFGEFNGGFLWTNDPSIPSKWAEFSKTSRFFEQAALEDLSDQTLESEFYRFPETVNYGWWRMFQSPNGLDHQQSVWSNDACRLTVKNQPVVCIHTHWITRDSVTFKFNTFIRKHLEELRGKDSRITKLLDTILPH
jgi:hypothetical protein